MLPYHAITPLSKDLYPAVLASDQVLYPTQTPLSLSSFQNWYSRFPEFAFSIDRTTDLFEPLPGRTFKGAGFCACIPLSSNGWNYLVNGKISEADVGNEACTEPMTDTTTDDSADENSAKAAPGPEGQLHWTLFDERRDTVMGIHVYHVERVSARKDGEPKLGTAVLQALHDILDSISQRTGVKPIRLCGFSGYCVSPSGSDLFKNVYGCTEVTDASKEWVLQSKLTGKVKVIQMESNSEIDGEGEWLEVAKCRMMATIPSDQHSLVWSYLCVL